MNILVTGGLGFIGSHTVVELISAGHTPIIVDNLVNSKLEVLNRLEKVTGVRPAFTQLDVADKEALDKVFDANKIDAVIHFAGLKAVGESVSKPLEYYSNNLGSTLTLIDCMKRHGVKNLIFSSSATVYGVPPSLPIKEEFPLGETTNPYGTSKAMIERILTDFCKANPDFNVALLRYFNPIGAHASGELGEDPNGIPNNLMPYITQVAVGRRDHLTVFGDDYDTPDGTCVRDYIHVVDLAIGHVMTLKKLVQNPGLVIYNLGTGKGSSVFEVLAAFEKGTGVKIPYVVGPRRAGDLPFLYACCDKAFEELGYKATRTVEDACRDAYAFQKKNPNGIQ
ncbi:MAG: UDP-glucose 4-epimerase GalE [Bacilli bacterium]|nr:UDP-glucose 4-epimerase GalE [Bacilli bacterium]